MDLQATERAVLALVMELILETFQDAYSISLLESRWPTADSGLYSRAFLSLVEKGLIDSPPDDACFVVTNLGYEAMGIAVV